MLINNLCFFLCLVTFCVDIVSKHKKRCRGELWRKHCLSCLLANALVIFFFLCVYSCHALFIRVSFCCLVCFGSLCPNMCSASLFSIAIHCLTAEVFFQPFKSRTLKFPAKDSQVCILLSLPALSLCTSSPGCLAASPLGLSCLHAMHHPISQNLWFTICGSRGSWWSREILNSVIDYFCDPSGARSSETFNIFHFFYLRRCFTN